MVVGMEGLAPSIQLQAASEKFSDARARISEAVRPGRRQSWALRNAVHRLEACATRWDPSLGALDSKSRRRLEDFCLAVLGAVGIPNCSPAPGENRSKFNKLRVGHVPRDPGIEKLDSKERHYHKRRRPTRAKREEHLVEFNRRLDGLLDTKRP
jgi:hypothetical protein